MSTSSILQQLNTIPNPGGIGIPVQQYATELQKALTAQLTSVSTNELSTLSSSQTALTSLQTALAQLQSATDTLASSQTWNQVTVTSSNPTAVSVTSTPGAQPSTYTVSIGNQAQTQINFAASGFQSTANGASNLTAGTIDIVPSSTGTTIAIAVTAQESLDAIVASVQAASTLVQASVINNGGTNPYELVFQSAQTGASGAFTLVDGGTSTIVSTQLNIGNPTQIALNATATLDGSVALQSSTNTFANAIPNMTFTALQSNSSATITAASNSASVTGAVQTWMNAYNSVVDLLKTDTSYTAAANGNPATTGPLFSDPIANSLLTSLPGTAEQSFSGTQYPIQNLASIGIVVDPATGHLEFQSATGFSGSSSVQDGQTMFTNAYNSNPSGVQSLFGVVQNNSASSALPTSGILGALWTSVNAQGTTAGSGLIGTELTSITAQQQNINSYLTMVNQQIQSQVDNFTSQLNQLNIALEQSQAQMQTIQSLIGSSTTSSSSSSSTIP